MFNQALTVNKKFNGETFITNTTIYFQLAQLNISQENPSQTKQWLKQALEIQEPTLPEKHPDLLATINLLKSL